MSKPEQTPVIYRGEFLGKRHSFEEMLRDCLETEEEIVLADPATYRISFTVSNGARAVRMILEEGGPLSIVGALASCRLLIPISLFGNMLGLKARSVFLRLNLRLVDRFMWMLL